MLCYSNRNDFVAVYVTHHITSQVCKYFHQFLHVSVSFSEIFLRSVLLSNIVVFVLSIFSSSLIHIAFPLHLADSQIILTFF